MSHNYEYLPMGMSNCNNKVNLGLINSLNFEVAQGLYFS